MNRRVSIALALLGVTALVVSSGGYSGVTADRGVDVAVVNDENAFVGIDVNQPNVSNGHNESVTLLEIENQVDSSSLTVTDFDVPGTSPSGPPPKVSDAWTEPNESASERRIVGRVVCAQSGNAPLVENSETVTVDVTVSLNDGAISVQFTRDVKITCEKPSSDGSSNASNGR